MIPLTMQIRRLLIIASTLLLVVLTGVVTGCTRDLPAPDNALETPEQLRGAIDARFENIEDARFQNVTLEYFGDGERVKVRQLLLVAPPDRLRVQTRLPGSDEIVSLLVSDGETFALHERDTNRYYTGDPTRENINRLLPVDLSAHDVVRVMLGGAPWDRFDAEGADPKLDWDSERGQYHYRVERDDGNELAMYVRHNDFAVVEVEETDADGDMIYAYSTEGWQEVNDIVLPAYRRFRWPARDLDFSIDVGDTELNNRLDSHLFEFPPPPGSEVIEVRQ